jgi:hypothetical protein
LQWNTFLGGNGYDYGAGMAMDDSGNAYMAGTSQLKWGSPVRAFGGGGSDAFAVKLDSSGALQWSTFLGGSGPEQAYDIALDADGNVYTTGNSGSWTCKPGCTLQPYNGLTDGFAAQLNPSGALQWNTFIGGSDSDYSYAIALAGPGAVYMAGASYATWGSPVRAYTASQDGWVTRIVGASALRSVGSEDGWILESKENSNQGGKKNSTGGTFTEGDDALDRQYRGILSYDTSVLPDDAVITGVSVRVKKKSLVGTNPFSTHGPLNVEIGVPFFGADVTLQSSDWEVPAGGGGPASTIGKKPSSGWYSAVIPDGFFGFISLVGTTQFRLSFNKGDNDDLSADYFTFFSGDSSASNRPMLFVQYYDP